MIVSELEKSYYHLKRNANAKLILFYFFKNVKILKTKA